jgi:hypothetical protein
MWKKINDYPNYEVSMWGEVRNIRRGTIMSQSLNDKGYPRVELWEKGKRAKKLVHRLVAEAFIPNPENKEIVNHKDANKSNPNVGNLEWATNVENMIHARKIRLYNRQTGVVQYTLEGKYIKTYDSLTLAAFSVNGSHPTLKRHIDKNQPYKGYKWRYADAD